MKKLYIYGLDKEKNMLKITLSKKQEFFAYFRELWKALDLEENAFIHHFGLRERGKHYEEVPARISKYVDVFEHTKSGTVTIDIFYGHKKISLIIKSNKRQQNKIIKELNKFAVWPKATRNL
jgi:hypothetical protein